MKTVTSVSGGKTSAYLAANFPTDYYIFSLVTTSDKSCLFPDPVLRKKVSDKLNIDFVGTLEDDLIITTLFNLEQFIGHEIIWLSGSTFDEVVNTKGGWLPNKLHRYCTSNLKLLPMFEWWAAYFKEPVLMNIGFRANEARRVIKMREKLNSYGFLEIKATLSKDHNNRNIWKTYAWQKPNFPLFSNHIHKDQIETFWQSKPVKFAPLNNCVGCFHRNPLLLKKMYSLHPNKMNWFESQESDKKMTWRPDVSYKQIRKSNLQTELDFDQFTECDSGYCEI